MIGAGPADHSTRPGVDDDSEVDPALADAVLGDVLHPTVGPGRRAELAVHQIIGAGIGGPAAGAALHPASTGFAAEGASDEPHVCG